MQRKILKIGLTLKEESVIYVTSRQSAIASRNCSLTSYQTICVGTQSDMDSYRPRTKNEYHV
ncbi:hypothetical protein DD589_30935 [Klebsiella pneumoniae]|nr:hypothetical protein DD589_30935 [Klebsiella pneumoniae]